MKVFLDELFINQYGTKRRGSTPKDIARVLGLMRHCSFVAPMGLFFTLRLQFLLSDKSPCGMLRPRQWWKYKRILLPSYILDELKRLYHSLSDKLCHHMWHRPIGLLIDRVPTIITQTDAAYSGLGGWSAEFDHKWRLSIQDLWDCGFPKFDRHNPQYGEPDIDVVGKQGKLCHINILEFIAMIIELWICVRQLFDEHCLIDGGYLALGIKRRPAFFSDHCIGFFAGKQLASVVPRYDLGGRIHNKCRNWVALK